MNSSRGLTLIELLVALAIGAVVAVGTFKMFQVSVNTRDTLIAQSESVSQLNRAMRMIESDLLQFVPNRQVRDAFGEYSESLVLDYEGLQFTRSGWANSRLLSYERSVFQRVSYYLAEPGTEHCEWLEDDTENEQGGCLIRKYRSHLDDDGSLTWFYQVIARPISALEWKFLVLDAANNAEYQTEPPGRNVETEELEGVIQAIEVDFVDGRSNTQYKRLIATPQLATLAKADGS